MNNDHPGDRLGAHLNDPLSALLSDHPGPCPSAHLGAHPGPHLSLRLSDHPRDHSPCMPISTTTLVPTLLLASVPISVTIPLTILVLLNDHLGPCPCDHPGTYLSPHFDAHLWCPPSVPTLVVTLTLDLTSTTTLVATSTITLVATSTTT